jgi:UDP-N-acetylglucosamine---dolichyl-phosphate N-acetylglucosaminyltransferase
VNCAAVIPCLNEEKTIAAVVSSLRKELALVVVVDDGSMDGTAQNAENAGAVVIRHGRNRGKGAALQTGLSHLLSLGFEWAVTLDGDGQHDPAHLPAFLRCAEETGAALVIGNRMHDARARDAAMPWLRWHVNRWMSRKLSRAAGYTCGGYLPDTQSGFRLLHLQTWASLALSAQRFEVESEMLMAFLAAKYAVEFVPIRVIASGRKSRIHPFTDTIRWWKWWWKRNTTALPDIRIRMPPCETRAPLGQEI